MKAAILKKYNSDFEIEDIDVPIPHKDEILIKVRASGLCGTDLHIQEGKIPTVKLPFIPGHETAGEIEELGENVTGFNKGDHVVIAIDIICGKCRFCLTGRENLCRDLTRIGFERNGGHAEYVVVPKEVVHKIDKGVPFDQAAIIPDAVACMYHAFKSQGKVTANQKICILGLGGLGFQGIQLAKLFGAEVFCTSRQEEKIQIAERYDPDGLINTQKQDLFEEIGRLTKNEMCDVVFDNIGIQSSIQESINITRPGGKVIVVGYIDPTFVVNYQNVMLNEKEIIGMRGSTRQDLIEAVSLVEKRKIIPFVYKQHSLLDINIAMEEMRKGLSFGRTVLIP